MSARCRRLGFAYVEILVATALISVLLVPAMSALRGAAGAGRVQAAEAMLRLRVASCLEEALAQPFALLSAAAVDVTRAAAVAAAIPGTPACELTVRGWDGDDADGDGDPLTGADPGLVHVTAGVAGSRHTLAGLAGG